jgi:hypothetical protein
MNYDNETWEERSARINKANEETRQQWITIIIPSWLADANLKPATYQKILLKASKGRTTDLNEMSYREVEKVLFDVSDRARAKEKKVKREALKADGKCLRCGGAGQADNWAATGFTCYACNGTGIKPID